MVSLCEHSSISEERSRTNELRQGLYGLNRSLSSAPDVAVETIGKNVEGIQENDQVIVVHHLIPGAEGLREPWVDRRP